MIQDISKQHRILVTGVGAIIGYGIVESLKITSKNLQITGCDIYEENYGRYLCDNFVKAAPACDTNYISWLNGVIEELNINLIIPGIEQDLYSIQANRDNINTKVVLNNDFIINLSKDKLETINFLQQHPQLNVIPTISSTDYNVCKDKLGLPFIVKPRFSYASKGFHIINDESDFRKHVLESDYKNLILQSYIGTEDEEYTVSAFSDGSGTVLDSIILRRYLSKEGSTNKAFVVREDAALSKFVQELVKLLMPVGPTNFQFRKQDGVAYLLEINPRISSACSLRTKFGYNEPLYCVNHFLENEDIEIAEKRFGKAIRFISDCVVYE